MPTGYTADIYEGKSVTLEDFAASCAHGMGAFIHQRDDNRRATLRMPVLDVSWYEQRLAETKAKHKAWLALSEEGRYAKWSDYVAERIAYIADAKEKNATLRNRYEDMISQVKAKDVPEKMQSFKEFMLDQLEASLDFDTQSDEKVDEWNPIMGFYEWYDFQVKDFIRDTAYYKKQIREERERHAERVDYINTMVETFGFEVE